MFRNGKAALLIAAVTLAAGAAAGVATATRDGGPSAAAANQVFADEATDLATARAIAYQAFESPPPNPKVEPVLGQGTLAFETGDRIDTPSGRFVTVTSKAFTAGSGPLVVRFAGEGYVEDWNRQAEFVGKSYAAMKVRVLLNGAPLAPDAVTLLDNSGKIGERSSLQGSRASAASFDWAGTVSTPGSQTVTVEFRNVHTWDSATLLRWTLTIQHA
jgi:hypothetical protein